MDSNHDSQIQSLESYQLDDPGAVRASETSLARDEASTIEGYCYVLAAGTNLLPANVQSGYTFLAIL